ncbi:MAG TPA: UPF0149 family protein [Rubrivivax sp.]|nr:UPF0149 family protein [Rubrivivax sp.]
MPLIDSSDAEIDAFDEVCTRLAGFDDRIGTEWADGYLTALAAGPLAIDLDAVLPRMAGDAFARTFADPEDEAMARRALQARMRVLANHLDPEALLDDPEALRLQPLVLVLEEAEREALVQEGKLDEGDAALLQAGALWAEGFSDALEDFAAELDPPADVDKGEREQFDELVDQVVILMLPDDAPLLQAHAQVYWEGQLPTREDLIDAACLAVQDLRLWWLDHAPRAAMRRVAPAPGRNNPCPCGSGLKYKKCHGKGA